MRFRLLECHLNHLVDKYFILILHCKLESEYNRDKPHFLLDATILRFGVKIVGILCVVRPNQYMSLDRGTIMCSVLSLTEASLLRG